MIYRIIYSRAAARDLEDLRLHLTEVAGSDVAGSVTQQIMTSIESLRTLPQRHECYAQFGGTRRMFPVSSWRIWYTAHDGTVTIDRILHVRRDGAPDLFVA